MRENRAIIYLPKPATYMPFFFLFILLLGMIIPGKAQTACNPKPIVGPNLVVNGGFETGNTGFTTSITCTWNTTNCATRCHNNTYSVKNQYYIGNSPSEASPCGGSFQSGFVGSPHSGSKFLMVDGDGANNPTVWEETVTIEQNSWYYFEAWISTIGTTPSTLAKLSFEIKGDIQATDIIAPTTPAVWKKYSQSWYSGTNSGSIIIRIKDNQVVSGGQNEDDFGLDDIVFMKGCPPAAYATQPELGIDQSLCGTNGSITLNSGVTLGVGETIYWSTGVDDGKTSLTVTTPAKYYVCVNHQGACTKVDSVTIIQTMPVDLGSDVALCKPSSVTLDAGFTGTGVTYQWYKDNSAIVAPLGINRTYLVNTSGKYKVKVSDVICPQVLDSVNVTIKSGQPEPVNVEYCRQVNHDTTITFKVIPAGSNYDWYDVPTGGSILAGGTGTSSYSKSVVYGDTLYVSEKTTTTTTLSSPNAFRSSLQYMGASDYYRKFDVYTDLVIEEVYVKVKAYEGACSNADGTISGAPNTASKSITIALYKDNVAVSPAQSYTTTILCDQQKLIPLNFTCSPGTNYELRIVGATSGIVYDNTQNAAVTLNDIIKIQASTTSNSSGGPFINWKVKASNYCSRVPVMAWDLCVLPLDFVNFNADKAGNNILLSWDITLDRPDTYFEVQRLVGKKFETIGLVKGLTAEEAMFSFLDKNAPSGTLYYRIKKVDRNKATYSEIITIENSDWEIEIGPNPFIDYVELRINSLLNKSYEITVFNSKGMLLGKHNSESGNSLRLLENAADGMYLIKVVNENEVKIIKVLKQ